MKRSQTQGGIVMSEPICVVAGGPPQLAVEYAQTAYRPA